MWMTRTSSLPPVEVCRVMSVKTARDLRNALFHVTDLDGTAKKSSD